MYVKNSMVMFIFFFHAEVPFFGENLFQKIKILHWNWNLEPRLNPIYKIWVFFVEMPFWVNLIQKFKIASLSWNLVTILFWICEIRWSCSLSLFKTFFASFVQNNHLVFWCNLIIFPAVCLPRIETSGFSS